MVALTLPRQPEPKAPDPVKLLRRLLIAAIVLALLGTGIWFLTRPEPATVLVHTVARGTVESTVANTRAGTVTADRRAKLAPGTGGPVSKRLVKKGDRVAKDQVLLELWHEDLDAQLALARSDAARSEATAEEAKLRAEWADRDAKRQVELQQREISAEEAVDRAVSAAAFARANQRAAETELEVRRKQVEVIRAQIDRTILRAPFAGIVAELNGEIGEFVTPSPVGIPTLPAVDLIDDSSLYVTAPIDEVDAAQVRVGMPVRVTLDAFRGRSIDGVVRRIAPYVLDREKQARTVDVEVDLKALPDIVVLLAGYSADVEIVLQERLDVLRVPSEALREGRKVLVLSDDGVLAERVIEPGLANWRFTEVISGLEPGARVVLTPDRAGVRSGARVKVEGAASAEHRP
jgi:HlyD family secretion protein